MTSAKTNTRRAKQLVEIESKVPSGTTTDETTDVNETTIADTTYATQHQEDSTEPNTQSERVHSPRHGVDHIGYVDGNYVDDNLLHKMKILRLTPRELVQERLNNIEAMFKVREQLNGQQKKDYEVSLVMALWGSLGL